jgi:serine kinase of HPr protein (carbohydrate metabolism regulator)
MSKQLNLIQTSPYVKELLKEAYKLHEIANNIETQAHKINCQEHPELIAKHFLFTTDWDIHIVGETEQGTMRYLSPEEKKQIYPDEEKKP